MDLKKIKFLSFILSVAFTICAFFIYKINRVVDINNDIVNTIVDLRLLNDTINFNMQNSIMTSNYDILNYDLANFDKNLTKLSIMDKDGSIDNLYGNADKINALAKIYDQKRNLVDMSNSINAGISSFILSSEYELKTDPKLKKFQVILLKLKNIRSFNIDIINDIEYDIQNLSANISGTNEINILKKVSYATNSLIALNNIYQQNNALNAGKVIDDIKHVYFKQYQDVLIRFKLMQVLSFVLLCMLIAFIFYQTKKGVALLRDVNMFKTVIDNDHSSIVISNAKNRITYVNKTFERISGYKFYEIVGKNPHILKSYIHSEDFYNGIRNAIANETSWECDNLISRAKDGSYIHEKVKFLPFFYGDKLQGFVSTKLDRTLETNMLNELAIKNDQIKAQSLIDKLTGFGNYFALTERLEQHKDGMLICISIKNFRTLRFFYKTKIIDAMIKSFSNTLKLCVDTSEINAELFRFQDDAFYIWYHGDNIVRDIVYIKEYFNFNEIEIYVDDKVESLPAPKIVIGVSLPNDTIQTNRLMQSVLANQQAYDSNKEIYYYQENDAIEMQYHKNQMITQLIEYALENDRVVVECQGIFDMASREKEAKFYEILVRIIDQSGKIHYPGEFLDVAMRTQLYVQITKKVISHAFNLVERYPDYTFSINLSSSDIADISVRKLLEEKLTLCSKPEHICFEMLESEEMSNYEIINSFIKYVKGYGCKISIDDFGSGYSNYYRILELDIDNIKIDGSIIKKLPYDQNTRVLVETIVNFAKKQGYKIVAEFVSSDEILEQIRKFDIQFAQGFLLGKPKAMNLK
ncbi:EAL domain-containing protein [Campylobacter sp. faydin G-140]|uniref:EAL domain-containing protein n=1 Tax=Campylobacter anatolicus TaxID=2829105 RepID=UPI001B9FD638|nr:EAL domain-containing protein [Campylobacter anatolicus]MBR8466278.1 EAL domain-containing protein [Campylobacter anatolicus]